MTLTTSAAPHLPARQDAAEGPALSRRDLLHGLGSVSLGLGGGLFAAAAARADAAPQAAGYRLEAAAQVSAARLDAEVANAFPLFNAGPVLPDFDATLLGAANDVELHRIVTTTTLPGSGEVVEITGLLALPVGARAGLPVVSWQHGTILSFDQVPSNLTLLGDADYSLTDDADSLETLFNVHRFAAQGFAVIAADYVGKGPLREGRNEAYVVKDVTTQTCTAVLDAGLAALRDMELAPGKLFLHGWSQGAINTQWLHQALRSDGVAIAASAVASPFNDTFQAWRFWAGRETFALPEGVEAYPAIPAWLPLCMIVLLGSYETYYGLDGLLEAAIRPEYHAMARQYWSDYSVDFAPDTAYPTSTDLLVEGFFDRFTDERNSAFIRQLAGNGASYWHYDSPMRFHFGLVDEAIHPEMVGRALAAGGELAIPVPVGNASHRATFLAGLYGDAASLGGNDNILSWFRSRL